MSRLWTGIDGWPAEVPEKLIKAIRAFPGANDLSDQVVHDLARSIVAAANSGWDEELPRNRAASTSASEKEIRKLHGLCKKLAAHMEGLHQPSIQALEAEGLSVFTFLNSVQEAQQLAQDAFGMITFGMINGAQSSKGRPQKIEASKVTAATAEVFERISGKHATFTTDPLTSKISGAWPDLLQSVFEALNLDASVPTQVRSLSVKKGQKKSD